MKTSILLFSLIPFMLLGCSSAPPVKQKTPEEMANPCPQPAYMKDTGSVMVPIRYMGSDGLVHMQCVTNYGKLPEFGNKAGYRQ